LEDRRKGSEKDIQRKLPPQIVEAVYKTDNLKWFADRNFFVRGSFSILAKL